MSRLVWVAKLLVSVALVWWLLQTVSFAPVISRMGEMRGIDVVFVLALAIGQFVLFGVRWWLVGRACAAQLPLRLAVRIGLISMFFNQTLPATVGGDIMRVYLSNRQGVPVRRAIAGVLIDRIVGMIALVGLVAATLPTFYGIVHDPTLRATVTMVAVGGMLALIVLLLAGGYIAELLKRWRAVRPIGILTDDLRDLFARPSAIFVVALSILIHLASVGLVMIVAAAMSLRLDPVVALVLVLPVILVMAIPVSLAGWGVREGALVVALGQVGVAAPDALAISIAFGLALLVAGMPGGVLWLWESRFPRLKEPIIREVRGRAR